MWKIIFKYSFSFAIIIFYIIIILFISKLDSDLFNSKNQTPTSTKYNNSDTHIKSHGSIDSTSNLKTEKVR